MAERSAHKEAFIKSELEWYNDYVLENLRKALAQKRIGVSDELLGSLMGKVRAAGDNSEGEFDLSFLRRGRFVDMGAGRGYNKGLRKGDSHKERIYRMTARTRPEMNRKPKKWYSKVAYGTLDRLIMRLVSNYEEEVINSVKSAEA